MVVLKNYIAIFSTTNHKGEAAIVAQLQYTAKNDCVTQKLNQYIIFYCSLQLNNISYFLSFSSCFLFLLVGFLSLQFSLTLSSFPFFLSLPHSHQPKRLPLPYAYPSPCLAPAWVAIFLGMGFSTWLCWWWGSWVGMATVVVDVGGSGCWW